MKEPLEVQSGAKVVPGLLESPLPGSGTKADLLALFQHHHCAAVGDNSPEPSSL